MWCLPGFCSAGHLNCHGYMYSQGSWFVNSVMLIPVQLYTYVQKDLCCVWFEVYIGRRFILQIRREQMFVSDNWVSMSEPLCSMSRFVCIVNLWYVHITPGMASSAVQIYHVLFLPTCVPVILPHFDSFFEQVCPAVRPHLSYAGSGSRRGGLL